MTTKPTAPTCIVVGCNELSCLADTARGKLWTFRAVYCSKCYLELQAGIEREIDRSRIELQFQPLSTDAVLDAVERIVR